MRQVIRSYNILVTFILCTMVSYFVWASATPKQRPSLVLEPFANTYELQHGSGIDFGFHQESRFPGFGGKSRHVDVVLSINGLVIECQDAMMAVTARFGLVRNGYISCPAGASSTIDSITVLTQQVIEQVNANHHWFINKNHIEDISLKDDNNHLSHIFSQTRLAGIERPYGVLRTPIMSWRSNKNRASLDLSAVIRWRNGDSRLRYELDFSVDNTCFMDIVNYKGASTRNELDQPEYQKIHPLRAYFSHRKYIDIPWKERVDLTHRYVTHVCENTAAWQ